MIPNQSLYRIYATECLIASAAAITIAFQAAHLPDLAIALYLGIGAALWCVDMALTGSQAPRGHGLSHALLIAAVALVWPLALVAVAAVLVHGVIQGLRKM